MEKLNVKELREKLLNKKMSFLLLDDIMHTNGYYSAIYGKMSTGMPKYIKDKLIIIYCAVGTGLAEVVISFEITIDNEPDQLEECFFLRVLDIEKFKEFLKK